VRSVPAAIAAPYATVASNTARVALYGNSQGGPRNFGLIPSPLPPSFRGLVSEAGNFRTTEESYFYSVRFDHQLTPGHGAFVRLGINPSDVTGKVSNGQNQLEVQNAFSRTANDSTRDLSVVSQLQSTLTPKTLNELRFQFARRGLGLTTNGSGVAVEIPGAASIGPVLRI
jgi:hypothetical protein